MRQREAKNTSKQDKILKLLTAQQLSGEQTSVLVSKTPRNHPMGFAPFSTQQNFNSKGEGACRNNPLLFRSLDATSPIDPFAPSEKTVDVPAHFAYPETNMALTCNYFGANDYSRKQTIQDIKMKVIEERSTRK